MHREPRRSLQVIIAEVVIDRRDPVIAQEGHLVAGVKHVPEIVKPGHAGGIAPFFGYREVQLQPVHDPEIAPEGVADADVVARPEPALTVAADAVRTAGEIIQIRRQEGGLAERRGVVVGGVERQQPALVDRNVLDELVVQGIVLDARERQRIPAGEGAAEAVGGEDRAVAGVE